MSVESDYLNWRRGPEVGCFFARSISAKGPAKYGQRVEVIKGMNGPAAIANSIAAAITNAVADPAVAASTLLLPEVTDLELLAQISLTLGGLPHWQTKTAELKGTPGGDVIAIHLTRMIPFGDKECPSEALALGPFDCFPATRKAPITALEIFVGQPSEFDPKKGPPHQSNKANVAHMEMNLQRPFWDIMWEKSVEGRKESLGNKDDDRAKAKVALVVPAALAQKLGCHP